MNEDAPDLSIPPELAPAFARFAQTLSEFLDDNEGLQARIPEEDPELAEVWAQGLREALREDITAILNIVKSDGFGEEVIRLSLAQAEAMLRACSAIRLKIYRVHLHGIPDEVLESGMVDPQGLDEPQTRALSIYAFLAHLQEILLFNLD